MSSFESKTLLRMGIAPLVVLLSGMTALAGNHYSVDLNKTEIVRLPENAGAVVIGNPAIADVTVHSANTLFVVGRGYGETNLVVLNSTGNTIMNANIQVINQRPRHGVRLFNGKQRESYSCAPYCLPSPILGDTPDFVNQNSGESEEINNNVSTALPTSPISAITNSSSALGSTGPTSFGSSTGSSDF